MLSAAVVIGALRVKNIFVQKLGHITWYTKKKYHLITDKYKINRCTKTSSKQTKTKSSMLLYDIADGEKFGKFTIFSG